MDISKAREIYYKIYDHENKRFLVPADVTLMDLYICIRTFGRALYENSKNTRRNQQHETDHEQVQIADPIKIWPIEDAPLQFNSADVDMKRVKWVAKVPTEYEEIASEALEGFDPKGDIRFKE
jgi:hypothetical protein